MTGMFACRAGDIEQMQFQRIPLLFYQFYHLSFSTFVVSLESTLMLKSDDFCGMRSTLVASKSSVG